MIEQLQTNKQLTKDMAKIQKQMGQVSDPSHSIDQMAFSAIDSNIINGLNTVYGENEEMEQVKAQQFRSVAALITEEIKQLKQNDPETWDRIRRNPVDQKKLTNHFLQKVIPPRARQLMEDDRIRNTPTTFSDLMAAFKEANQIKDPEQRKQIQERIRQEMWAERTSGNTRGQQQSMNNIYRNS